MKREFTKKNCQINKGTNNFEGEQAEWCSRGHILLANPMKGNLLMGQTIAEWDGP